MTTANLKYLPKEVQKRKGFDIRAGDTVRVKLKVEEKGKTRLQSFEGLVIARKHGRENGGTITVRRIASGVGVERIFPLYSPMIESIEVLKRSRVRRSKLYFLRDTVTRRARHKLRRITNFSTSTDELDPGELVGVEEEKPEEAPVEGEELPEEENNSEETPKEEDSKDEQEPESKDDQGKEDHK